MMVRPIARASGILMAEHFGRTARTIATARTQEHTMSFTHAPRLAMALPLISLPALAQSADWTPTNGPFGGFIAAVGVTGNDVVAGTAHGSIFKSSDAGLTWRDHTMNLPNDVLQHIVRAGKATFVATRFSGLWRLDDQGGAWVNVSAGLPHPNVHSITAHGDALITSSPLQVLARSDDRGQTWQLIPAPETLLVLASDGDVLYAGGLFGVYRSADGGQSWTLAPTGNDISVGQIITAGSTMYATSGGGLYQSIDRGHSWQQLAEDGLPATATITKLGAIGDALMAGVAGAPRYAIYQFDQAGKSWVRTSAGFPQGIEGFSQSIASADSTLLVGTTSSLFRSIDGGQTWTRSVDGLAGVSIRDHHANDGMLVAVMQNSPRVARSTDGGRSWRDGSTGISDDAMLRGAFAFDNDTLFVGSTRHGIYRSIDGGETFATHNVGVPRYNSTAGDQFREIEHFERHNGRFFAATGFGIEFFNQRFNSSGAGPLRLSIDGQTWERITTGFPIIAFNLFFEPVFDPISAMNDVGHALMTGTGISGIIRTMNLGGSWVAGNDGLPRNALGHFPVMTAFVEHNSAIFASASGFMFGGLGGTGIFRSDDGGQSWIRSDAGIPAQHSVIGLGRIDSRLFASVGGQIVASPFNGVYVSDDLGQSWTQMGTTLQGIACEAMTIDGDTPFVAVRARGVWRLDEPCYADCDTTTGAGVLDIFDFLCFGNRFSAGDPYACDCDTSTGNGVCDIFDFLCFGNAFNAGCD